ncbi:MAG: hypothetical protein AABX70_07090 [Nanoarchaeota archaeon]
MGDIRLAVTFLNQALQEKVHMNEKKKNIVLGMKALEGTKYWHEANIDRYRRILDHLGNIHENPPGAGFNEDVERMNKSWLELAQGCLRDILRDIPEG